MTRRRAIRGLRATLRGGVSAIVLGGLILGTIGFPIAPPGTAGGAYPCQGHGCGCRSAEECWFGCCCLTPAQRLAWAKRNGVRPPAELVRLARRDSTPKAKVAACCSGKSHRSCCQTAGKKTAACCAKPVRKATAKAADSEETSPTFTAGRCRGLGRWWVASGQPLALPERPVTLGEPAGSEPILLVSVGYSLDADSPPTRPG